MRHKLMLAPSANKKEDLGEFDPETIRSKKAQTCCALPREYCNYLDFATIRSTAALMLPSDVPIAPPFGGIVFLPLIALA